MYTHISDIVTASKDHPGSYHVTLSFANPLASSAAALAVSSGQSVQDRLLNGAITYQLIQQHAVDSKKLEDGCRIAGSPYVFSLGLEDDPVPTFWLLLQVPSTTNNILSVGSVSCSLCGQN